VEFETLLWLVPVAALAGLLVLLGVALCKAASKADAVLEHAHHRCSVLRRGLASSGWIRRWTVFRKRCALTTISWDSPSSSPVR
jgi:hypothetical protein